MTDREQLNKLLEMLRNLESCKTTLDSLYLSQDPNSFDGKDYGVIGGCIKRLQQMTQRMAKRFHTRIENEQKLEQPNSKQNQGAD